MKSDFAESDRQYQRAQEQMRQNADLMRTLARNDQVISTYHNNALLNLFVTEAAAGQLRERGIKCMEAESTQEGYPDHRFFVVGGFALCSPQRMRPGVVEKNMIAFMGNSKWERIENKIPKASQHLSTPGVNKSFMDDLAIAEAADDLTMRAEKIAKAGTAAKPTNGSLSIEKIPHEWRWSSQVQSALQHSASDDPNWGKKMNARAENDNEYGGR